MSSNVVKNSVFFKKDSRIASVSKSLNIQLRALKASLIPTNEKQLQVAKMFDGTGDFVRSIRFDASRKRLSVEGGQFVAFDVSKEEIEEPPFDWYPDAKNITDELSLSEELEKRSMKIRGFDAWPAGTIVRQYSMD